MKLMRYSRKSEPAALARMGALVAQQYIADLRAGHALFLREEKRNAKGEQIAEIFAPPYITQFLHLGEPGWEALAETHAWMAELAHRGIDTPGMKGEPLFLPLAECRLYAPVRPSKLIAVRGNYGGRGARDDAAAAAIPSALLKPPSAVIGPGRDVLKPAVTRALDCAAELAVVIGRRCKHVRPEKAMEAIAGYTILNDVSARDVSRIEHDDGGSILLGEGFDTFAPLGPWLVTRDEIADPMNLRIRTRVNGELRREGGTAAMVHSIHRLVAYFSQMTLMPGDVIATGAPPPVADAEPQPLLAGDVIEAEVEGVGTLRNAVVDEPI